MKSFSMTLAGVVVLMAVGMAQAETVTYADLRGNFVTATTGQSTKTATANTNGLTDSLGAGYWNYYQSAVQYANPTTLTNSDLLTWKGIGNLNPQSHGYGGTAENSMPAVATTAIWGGGVTPDATQVAMHTPQGTARSLAMTWTAGASEATNNLSIVGSFRRDQAFTNLASWDDGVMFTIWVNNEIKFQSAVASNDNTAKPFSLTGLSIAAGQTVALTLDYHGIDIPGGTPSYGGDESLLSCTISATTVPEPSTIAMLAVGMFGLIAYAWRKRK